MWLNIIKIYTDYNTIYNNVFLQFEGTEKPVYHIMHTQNIVWRK